MIGLRARIEDNFRAVRRAAQRARRRYLFRAAALVRIIARQSIRRRKGAAEEGQPPHTHTRRLPRSIFFGVERDSAVIGPSHRLVGTSGAAHELGETYYGVRYPARPFMGPTLRKAAPKLPKIWADSIRT